MLEAAERIVLKEGPAALTTTRIADVAGVSVGSLYQYFPNKQSVLVSLALQYMERDFSRFRELGATLTSSPLGQVVSIITSAMIEEYARNASVRAVLIQQLYASDKGEAMRKIFERYVSEIASIFSAALPFAASAWIERRSFVVFFAAEGVMREAALRQVSARERQALAELTTA